MYLKRVSSAATAAAGLLILLAWVAATRGQDGVGERPEAKPGEDVAAAGAGGEWLHEDLESGYAEARATGKPLLIAFK